MNENNIKDSLSDNNQIIQILEAELNEYKKKNKFFEMLINSLPGFFYLFDNNYNIHSWNKNVEQVIGYSHEEITTKDIFELFSGRDAKFVERVIQKAFETGKGDIEAELVTKDGKKIPYFFSGVTANITDTSYLLGIGLDISRLKKAQTELLESEALYRLFADRITEGIMMFQNFQIMFVNNAFVKMFGYKNDDKIIGMDVMSFVSDNFNMYFREMYNALLDGICNERFFQARWLTKDSNEIWVEGRANIIQIKGKSTILITARDITETKLREISMQEEADVLRRENVKLRSSIKDRYRFGDIIGKSPAIQKVYELILNASASNANVIIYGESGTGKELVAKAIHQLSSRSSKRLVPVNCAAIPENLLESEFFGHKKGAFTGANADKSGYLDRADGGCLFLDEVGELNPGLQAKLLRAIEDGGYSPVGSNALKKSDFRIIAATNKNLLEMSKTGKMREDFFFRIHIIPIQLPPLRSRKDDIPLLVEHFMRIYSKNKKIIKIPGQKMEEFLEYDWPGNVRELQNVIQRFIAVGSLDFLTPMLFDSMQNPEKNSNFDTGTSDSNLKGTIEDIEKNCIIEALKKFKGNKSKAADSLGITRKTLSRKVKRLEIVI